MTTVEEHRPVDLTVDKTARELRIEWADGVTSVYGFDYLAAMCPCAICGDKRAEMKKNPLHVLPDNYGPAEFGEVSMVGRYALNFRWVAGCSSGIYSFDFLRAIDPTRKNEKQEN